MSEPSNKAAPGDTIEAKNIANILKRLQDGKVLTANEKETLADWHARQEASKGDATSGRPNVSALAGCRPQKRRFAELVAGGRSQADAYREAYGRPNVSARDAAERGSRCAADPRVKEFLASVRAASAAGALLTINERLKLLADNARIPGRSAAARNAQARAIEVYNKTAGDQAPERQEHLIKGDPAAPLTNVPGVNYTKADKIAALLKRRKDREAAAAPVT